MTDLPLLPVNLDFAEVHAAAGEAVKPGGLRKRLKRLKALRRIGNQHTLVSSEALQTADPELYAAVIRRRMVG